MQRLAETRFRTKMNSRHARVPARPNLLLLDSTGSVSQLAERSKTCRSFSLGTLRVTFLLCGYILYLDFIWAKTVVAPIRLDLLFLIPLSTLTFTGVGVWGVRKPGRLTKMASVLLLAFSVPTLLVFAQGIWKSSKDIVRLNARPALIFEAQFRNPQTFRNFFGNIDPRNDPRVGHFRAEDPKSWASRVIVNDQGHFWLMYKSGENVECVYSQADLGEISLPGTFKAQSETGLPQEVLVSAWSGDRFALNFSPQGTYTFVRAPVSYNETVSAPGKVSFHGSFSQVRIDRDYIYLIQIWLWQSGERWVAYYVRRNAKCGSINDFVSASAYEGKPRGGQFILRAPRKKSRSSKLACRHRQATRSMRISSTTEDLCKRPLSKEGLFFTHLFTRALQIATLTSPPIG